MANTDFIQATIEIFGAVITLVVAMILIIITGNKRKSEKDLFAAVLASGLTLVLDAGWYIFDGSMTTVGVVMNWICNYALFICNPVIVTLIIRYVCNLLRDLKLKPNWAVKTLAFLLAGAAFCSPLVNMVHPWMFLFDEKNVYYRMTGWYVYTVMNSLAMLVCFFLIVMHRRAFKRGRRNALYILFLAQIAGIAIQAFHIGISFIQLGSAAGIVVISANYLYDWIRDETKGAAVTEDKKKIWLIECIFSIMILFVSASIISCVVSVNTVSRESSEQNSTTLAYMAIETVEGVLTEPINVSRTMAQSEIIMDALSREDLEQSETEEKMLAFMKRIKEKYGYQMIFVASEKTKAYYTYEGLSRYMDVSEGSVDSWYSEFEKSGAEYELNIDADKDNDMHLGVFVNMEVRDDAGNYIGACGVATSMESLMEILSRYEKNYQLDIMLTNQDGLVQVSTDRRKIESDIVSIDEEAKESQDFVYKRDVREAVLTKYMGDYGWYLQITDRKPDKLNVFEIILPSLIIYVVGILLMIGFSFAFAVRERRRTRELRDSKEESETARAESQAKGKFLANMSHEIRTPINAVLGMDTMILRESKEPQIREYAMVIQNSGNILLSLINDILDISKIESGKMELVPQEYDFSMLLHDVMNMISIKAEQKGLELKMDVDQNLPAGLYGDDVRLRQIIVNLMNNAVKYTNQGSVTLQVTGETQDRVVRLLISVKDTGIGIKEEDIKKLYEEFVRIEEARNRNVEGTGLGMSITVQLLELMHSKLEVASVYGEGSEFSFVLEQKILDSRPIGDIAKTMQRKAEDYNYQTIFTAPDARVLVVDDNDVNRIVFTNLLKETLLQIDEADCGVKALDLIFGNKYDIIFLDHMMPDMDGIEVLHRVKENREHPNVDTPVIVLTANAISGVREQYMAAGFDDYLTKPIIPEQLENTISLLLPPDKKIEGERVPVAKKEEAVELPMVEGIDWYYTKLHFTDTDVMMTTLQSFAKSLKSEAEGLQQAFRALMEDSENEACLDAYRIKVHAMKSTATLLGCVPLGGVAAALEMAAKAGQIGAIRDMTPHFLTVWLGYREKLHFVVPVEEDKKEIEDISLILDYLRQLKDAAEAFDVHGADLVLEQLKHYQYEDEINQKMEKIAAAVNNLDVDEVMVLCDEVLKRLGR